MRRHFRLVALLSATVFSGLGLLADTALGLEANLIEGQDRIFSESGSTHGLDYRLAGFSTGRGTELRLHMVGRDREMTLKMSSSQHAVELKYDFSGKGEHISAHTRIPRNAIEGFLHLNVKGQKVREISLGFVDRHCGCDFLETFFFGLCGALPPGARTTCEIAQATALTGCALIPWSVCNIVDEPPCVEFNGGHQPAVQTNPHAGGAGTRVDVRGAFFPASSSYQIVYYPDNTTSMVNYGIGSGQTDARGFLTDVVQIPNLGSQGRLNGVICVQSNSRGIVEGSPFAYNSSSGEPPS